MTMKGPTPPHIIRDRTTTQHSPPAPSRLPAMDPPRRHTIKELMAILDTSPPDTLVAQLAAQLVPVVLAELDCIDARLTKRQAARTFLKAEQAFLQDMHRGMEANRAKVVIKLNRLQGEQFRRLPSTMTSGFEASASAKRDAIASIDAALETNREAVEAVIRALEKNEAAINDDLAELAALQG